MNLLHACATDRRRRHLALAIGALTSTLAICAPAGAATGAARHLYTVVQVSQTKQLVPFDVSASGGFTERQDHAVAVPYQTDTMVVGRDARTVYVGSTGGYDNQMHQIPGTISVFAVAGDGSLSLVQTVAAPPRQMIVTPDGARLIEWDNYGLVVSYPIRSDGSLGAALPNPSVTGSARALGMTLDGRTLYIATYPQQIQQYAIASNGALTAQDPADVGIYGCRADFLGVTPDGTQLDATCYSQGITMSLASGGGLTFNGGLFTGWGGSPTVEDVRGRALYKAIYPNALEHMQRQLDGSLADFPTPLIFDAARITGIAADPGGTLLAVATAANSLETYAIAADGSLSGPIASIPTTLNGLSMLTYAPDQPPVATLSATPDGRTVMFDASASTPATGTIARYDWTFGDGTVLADGGPTPRHAYASVGAYTATVTLTDSAGCSTAEIYTGTMPVCAGSADAAASMVVHLVGTPPIASVSPPPIAPVPPAPVSIPAPAPLTPIETLVVARSLTGSPVARGGRVRLSWTPAPGAPPSKRFLVEWSPLHSAQSASDPLMHVAWTTDTSLLMPAARPGTTLHYAVYAYGSDGVLAKGGKVTIRLPR